MRHCQYCDALNPDDALQCGNCGKSLPPAGKNIVSSSDKIPENAGVLDIGSGAGFPALPLAILRKDLNITALDGVCKKVSFIGVVARTIQLGNVAFVHTRAEDYAKNFRETFDCVVLYLCYNMFTYLYWFK